MTELVIADTSCLIILQKLGLLRLLPGLYETVTVTSVVADEFLGFLPDWVTVQVVDASWLIPLQPFRLDPGEASALALALERRQTGDVLVLIDDLKGRLAAERLAIPIKGSVGVLLQAKREGLLEMVGPHLEMMRRQTNFRLSETLIQKALKEAGEL